MGRFARLAIALAILGLAFSAAPIRVSADCSGLSYCNHGLNIFVQNGLLYVDAPAEVNPGDLAGSTYYMHRDVYPYDDNGSLNTGAYAPCGAQIEDVVNPNGYGEPAHYGFYSYVGGGRCDQNGYDAFLHYHPYTPNPTYYYISYWSGQYISCFSNEPTGMSGTC